MAKAPKSLPQAGPRKASVPSRPSGIRGKASAGGPAANYARIANALGVTPDAVNSTLVARLLGIDEIKAAMSGKEINVDTIVAALGTKTPAEWQSWMQQNGMAASAPPAKPSTPPPGVPIDGGAPIKGKVNLGDADAADADNPLRNRLVELGVKPEEAAKIPDADLQAQVAELERVTAEAQAKAGQGEDAQRAARKDEKRAESLARARRRNAREQQPPKAAAVSTAGEKPPTKNVDPKMPSGGAKDLAALSSEDLFKLARSRQVEEGMGQSIVVGGPRAGGVGSLPAAADIGAVDGPIEVLPGRALPVPSVEDDLPMLEPADGSPPPRRPPAGGSGDGSSNAAPEEPFFKAPYNPFGTTKGKDNFGRAIVRNARGIALYGGVPLGVGASMYYGSSGGQQRNEDDYQKALQEAVAAQRWLQQKFGTYQDRPQVRQQPDMPQSPEDTIRSLRGTR